MPTSIAPALKWYGGKHYLADWIVSLMPRHLHYVEPYGGGLAVLLRKDPHDPRHQWSNKTQERGVSEVVNDIDCRLMNFWRVLQREGSFRSFARTANATPFSQPAWEEAADRSTPVRRLDVQAAVAFFVRCRQSRAGGLRGFATLSRNRTRRRMNEQASAWLSCVEGLPAVHQRLRRVVILCMDALDVIRGQDGEKTLFYLDPPYHPNARASVGSYKHEMTDADHRELVGMVRRCRGAVMLSGYRNPLYDRELTEWNRHDRQIDNKVAGTTSKRKMNECVWCNF